MNVAWAREPLSSAVREGDMQWARVVRWVHFALVAAEEYGLDSNTVIEDGIPGARLPLEARRLLGLEGELGALLGLSNDWAAQIIASVGNYAQIFARNFGEESDLQMPRGLNTLWSEGGLLYAPIFN